MLPPELEAIKDAVDKNTGGGRDRPAAVELAAAYVAAHPELDAEMADWDLPKIVEAISLFRAAGSDVQQWRLEAYHLAKWEPQEIGGEYHATLRTPQL